MKVRTVTNVYCPCGHRGSIVESFEDDGGSFWYLAILRGLSHAGQYDGLNRLFAETTPACGACGLSLTPDHVASKTDMTCGIGPRAKTTQRGD